MVENELTAEHNHDPIIIDLKTDSDTEDTNTLVKVRPLEEKLEIEQLQLVYPEMRKRQSSWLRMNLLLRTFRIQ